MIPLAAYLEAAMTTARLDCLHPDPAEHGPTVSPKQRSPTGSTRSATQGETHDQLHDTQQRQR